MLKLTVPGEPQAKQRPRMTRQGRTYTPAKTVNYETLIQECFASTFPGHVPLEGALVLNVQAHFTVPASWSLKKQRLAYDCQLRPTKKPDVDNVIKSVADSLNGIAWRDDSQIVTVIASKWYSDRPRVDIEITEFGEL
jgi:Holliday junction resolvase RusA-like endonuclease